MQLRLAGVTVLTALWALALPGRARACEPIEVSPHRIDPAMVGVDQTPPQLAQPKVSDLQSPDDTQGCGATCGWDHIATLSNLATDDMTPVGKIGYLLTVVAGTAPSVTAWRDGMAIDESNAGTLFLFWNGGDEFDFTLQLVAVDQAGNQSAPQTVRIQDGTTACRVGSGRGRGGLAPLIVALALGCAAARRRRR